MGWNRRIRLDEPAVPNKYLWRLDEALSGIFVQGLQAPHQHEINEQVEGTSRHLARDPQTLGQCARIQQAALCMRQHRPEAAQRGRRDARPDGRDIAFEVSAQKIFAPG